MAAPDIVAYRKWQRGATLLQVLPVFFFAQRLARWAYLLELVLLFDHLVALQHLVWALQLIRPPEDVRVLFLRLVMRKIMRLNGRGMPIWRGKEWPTWRSTIIMAWTIPWSPSTSCNPSGDFRLIICQFGSRKHTLELSKHGKFANSAAQARTWSLLLASLQCFLRMRWPPTIVRLLLR